MPIVKDWYKHSPSSVNKFTACPSAFVINYGMGVWEEETTRQAMGHAAEHGLARILFNGATVDQAIESALDEFDKLTMGEANEDREAVPGIVRQFVAALDDPKLKDRGEPLSMQTKLGLEAGSRFGLRFAITGKTDFTFANVTVDTKATMRCPGEPKPEHVGALSVYWKLSGRPQALLYATPKKYAVFHLGEAEMESAWRRMLANMHRIENLDTICDEPLDALNLVPIATDSFYLGPKALELIETNVKEPLA